MATGSGADSRVAGGGSAFSFSLSSVFFVFFSAVFVSPFSSLPPLLISLLFSSPSLGLLSFFQSPSPVFIGKNRGGRHGGAATVGRPLHYRSVDKKDGVKWVKCGRLIAPNSGKKLGEKWRRNSSSSPASRVQGKKMMMPLKKAPFRFFFVYFILFYFILYLLFFCGDPKMGYNNGQINFVLMLSSYIYKAYGIVYMA